MIRYITSKKASKYNLIIAPDSKNKKLVRPAGYSQPSPLVPPLLEPGGASLVDRSTGTIQTGLEKPVRLAGYSEFPQLPSS